MPKRLEFGASPKYVKYVSLLITVPPAFIGGVPFEARKSGVNYYLSNSFWESSHNLEQRVALYVDLYACVH